jgi:hypothetical protein
MLAATSRVELIVGSTIDQPGDPGEVTAYMGCEPSELRWHEIQSLIPGTDRYETHRTWSWVIRSPLGDEASPSQRVSALVESLLPMRDRIRAIPTRYWRFVEYMSDSTSRDDFPMVGDFGLGLSVACMRGLVDLELEFSLSNRLWTPEGYRVNIETGAAEVAP